VDGQVRGQVRGQVYDQVRGQVGGQVYDQVDGQVYDQVGGQVRGQVGDQVYDQVDGQVRDQVRDQVRERFSNWYYGLMYGQHWAGYYSWLDAMERLGVTGMTPIHGQMEVARNAGWWWCFRGFAVVTDRPCILRRDPQNRLHCADGPAIAYRDGWGFYAWHGRRVPAWVILSPTIKRIAEEENVEIRRCAIESLGWDRFIRDAELKPVHKRIADPGNPGQILSLYDVPVRLWGDRVRVLLCTNGSPERDGTRRRYGLTVPVTLGDPLEAAAWTVGLTKDQYARTVRRT
jgi:hypothetical protein